MALPIKHYDFLHFLPGPLWSNYRLLCRFGKHRRCLQRCRRTEGRRTRDCRSACKSKPPMKHIKTILTACAGLMIATSAFAADAGINPASDLSSLSGNKEALTEAAQLDAEQYFKPRGEAALRPPVAYLFGCFGDGYNVRGLTGTNSPSCRLI
jgi:hypothetical protein